MHAVLKCCNKVQLLSKRIGLGERFIGREDGGSFPNLDFWNLHPDPGNTFRCTTTQISCENYNARGKISGLI